MKNVNVEIITIGDEILIGQIVDTNSAWMAQELHDKGIVVHQITSISDNQDHIIKALKLAESRADIILMTGGLGPTKDDITKKTLATYFNDHLVLNEEVLEHVESLFASRNVKMPEVNRLQAQVPSRATVLKNIKGTAPGMWFEENNRVFVSMPGVPYEMKYLLENEVLPRLKQKFKTPELVYRTVLTQGIGESSLMEHLEKWEVNLLVAGLKLAWLPSAGNVRLRISGSGTDRVDLEHKIQQEVIKLKSIIPQYFVGEHLEKFEVEIGSLLRTKGWTLATAESCTGGYLAHLITSVADSSDYYQGTVVSYSNAVKERELGVSWESLKKHGAVSKQVVEEMVVGVKNKLQTTCAIATSGVAGPSGGSKEKPVGFVWIAVSTPLGTVSESFLFGTDRAKNIERASISGLRMLQKEILKHS
ncbi:MAG: competence/damage-inducible protein A [Flavobacteriales bacterium]|nr:competence/damage-inducible protein A [Flavobacteriales bacterium]